MIIERIDISGLSKEERIATGASFFESRVSFAYAAGLISQPFLSENADPGKWLHIYFPWL